MKIAKLVTALAFLGTASVLAEEKLGFVFELVRHGARAPDLHVPDGIFKVPTGMLTATGHR